MISLYMWNLKSTINEQQTHTQNKQTDGCQMGRGGKEIGEKVKGNNKYKSPVIKEVTGM